MAYYEIPENPIYDSDVRRLENNDPADADEIFNPLILQILTNMAVIKKQVDSSTYVTGIMSANGALNLGWKPKVVIIFATAFESGNNIALNIGMATSTATNTYPQRNRVSQGESVSITDTGFSTLGLVSNGNNAPSGSSPLRYVAFR